MWFIDALSTTSSSIVNSRAIGVKSPLPMRSASAANASNCCDILSAVCRWSAISTTADVSVLRSTSTDARATQASIAATGQ